MRRTETMVKSAPIPRLRQGSLAAGIRSRRAVLITEWAVPFHLPGGGIDPDGGALSASHWQCLEEAGGESGSRQSPWPVRHGGLPCRRAAALFVGVVTPTVPTASGKRNTYRSHPFALMEYRERRSHTPNLPLATDIADLVREAPAKHRPMEARRIANELFREHPEAEATASEILQVLVDEEGAEFAE